MGCCNINRNNLEKELKMNNFGKLDKYEEEALIQKQMEESICKISKNNKNKGTGFFCKIPFPDYKHLLPVLITNNNVLGKNDINEGRQIDISLNNDNEIYKIMIDDRKKYINSRSFNITIIEIKKDDGLDFDNFLEIDENIYENNLIETYKDKPIYLLHYPLGEKMQNNVGLIKNINEDNINIIHSCSSKNGSLGGPLLNLENYKVIGIQKDNSDDIELNQGIFIKLPIEKFYDKNC